VSTPYLDLADGAACEVTDGCITCGDVAVEVRVIMVDSASELATGSDETGLATEVDTMLVGPVKPGDRLLVHAGTAIARVGREDSS
jgi:hydrogenase maturation factor